jgi:hypothetical protein
MDLILVRTSYYSINERKTRLECHLRRDQTA